jgi:hypothetical protein
MIEAGTHIGFEYFREKEELCLAGSRFPFEPNSIMNNAVTKIVITFFIRNLTAFARLNWLKAAIPGLFDTT